MNRKSKWAEKLQLKFFNVFAEIHIHQYSPLMKVTFISFSKVIMFFFNFTQKETEGNKWEKSSSNLVVIEVCFDRYFETTTE